MTADDPTGTRAEGVVANGYALFILGKLRPRLLPAPPGGGGEGVGAVPSGEKTKSAQLLL